MERLLRGKPTETQLEGIGVYDLPADNVVEQFYGSTATAADVALLEAQRAGGIATFVFKATGLAHARRGNHRDSRSS